MWRDVLAVGSITIVGLFMVFFAVMAWEWFTETRQLYRRTSRPRYGTASIRQEAWRAEQASARIFTEGHRRMMDAAFRFDWTKHFDWTKWYE